MNKYSVFGTVVVPCLCGFVERLNASCVDDIQEYTGVVLSVEFVCVHYYYISGLEVQTIYPSWANAICYFTGFTLTVAKACVVFAKDIQYIHI